MHRPRLGVTLRWIVAGLVGAAGVFLLAYVPMDDGNWGAFQKLLGGLGGLLVGAVFVSPELVRWTLTPLSGLIDSILLPSEEVVPPADLKLARFYSQSLRHAEAAEEYARILHYHARHAEAYLEGIHAAGLAGDEKLARKFYQGAQKVLRSEERRRLLEDVYAARHQPLPTAPEPAQETAPDEADVPPDDNRLHQ